MPSRGSHLGVSSSSPGHGHHLRTDTSLPSDLATLNLKLVGYFWPCGLSELTPPGVGPETGRARTEAVLRARRWRTERRDPYAQGAAAQASLGVGLSSGLGRRSAGSASCGPGDGPLARGCGHRSPLVCHSGRFQSTFTHQHSSLLAAMFDTDCCSLQVGNLRPEVMKELSQETEPGLSVLTPGGPVQPGLSMQRDG